jgi:hypothetical protein
MQKNQKPKKKRKQILLEVETSSMIILYICPFLTLIVLPCILACAQRCVEIYRKQARKWFSD